MKPLCFYLSVFLLSVSSLKAEILINEFLASNKTGKAANSGERHDWIELYNSGSEDVSLEGYYLTDDPAFAPSDPETYWQLPDVTLQAESYLLIYASGIDEPTIETDGSLHASFKLSSSGEYLALLDPDGQTVLQEFAPNFPSQREDVSYGITNNDTHKYITAPTPGTRNRNGIINFVEPVVFLSKPRIPRSRLYSNTHQPHRRRRDSIHHGQS